LRNYAFRYRRQKSVYRPLHILLLLLKHRNIHRILQACVKLLRNLNRKSVYRFGRQNILRSSVKYKVLDLLLLQVSLIAYFLSSARAFIVIIYSAFLIRSAFGRDIRAAFAAKQSSAQKVRTVTVQRLLSMLVHCHYSLTLVKSFLVHNRRRYVCVDFTIVLDFARIFSVM